MTAASAPELRLAPMAGVTNAPFRLVARECGAGLLTSEEIDARALVADNAHTREIAEVVAAVGVPVTGNGDVGSRDEAAAMQRATGCAA